MAQGCFKKVGKSITLSREKKVFSVGCEHDCFNEHRLAELEKEFHEIQEKQSERHREFYNRIGLLEQKTALYSNDLNHIKDTVDEMNNNLKSLMEKPGKRWDAVVIYIITAIIGIIVGFALKGVFPM